MENLYSGKKPCKRYYKRCYYLPLKSFLSILFAFYFYVNAFFTCFFGLFCDKCTDTGKKSNFSLIIKYLKGFKLLIYNKTVTYKCFMVLFGNYNILYILLVYLFLLIIGKSLLIVYINLISISI